MDLRKEEKPAQKKRNEMLLKILEEEYNIQKEQMSELAADLVEALPFEFCDKRSLNSLKHGMNMNGLLPCKLKSCIHSQYCPIFQSEDTEHIEMGSPCRLEIELYLELIERLESQYPTKETRPATKNLADYIMALIKNDRNSRLIALEGGFIRRAEASRNNNRGLSLGYRYWNNTRSKKNKVVAKIIEEANRH